MPQSSPRITFDGKTIMKFVCLGYIDESQWDQLPEADRREMMNECFDYDDELRRGGHFLGGEALGTAGHAATLRMRNGGVVVTDGPYAETKETLGGILLLEARDFNHAVALMSTHPGVKSGPFEIRPAADEVNRQIAARDAAVAKEVAKENRSGINATDTLRAALTTSYQWLTQLAEDLADAPLTAPTPAGGNHPLWIMGHVTFSKAGLLAMISGRPNPLEHWKDLFAGGTQPLRDRDGYPPFPDVMAAYRQTHQAALDLLGEIGEAGLAAKPKAVAKELSDEPDFQSVGRLFLFITMHEMSHRGQLADARRALGRKPFA